MQIIRADDVQTINEVMYGPRSDALLNDLRSGLSNYDQSILSPLGRAYEAKVQENFEAVSGWKVVNATRKAVASLSGFDAPEVILPLFTDEAFQTAPLIMQRLIMADTEIRQLYVKHRIDGWSDTYIDSQPGIIGQDHYDHRIAMNGIVEVEELKEGGQKYSVTEFFQADRPFEEKLSQSNLLDIRRSSMYARSKMKKGLADLTSLYEEKVQ